MEYLEQIKQQPDLYNQLTEFSKQYVLDCGREVAFPTGNMPSLDPAKSLIKQTKIELNDSELEIMLNHITDEAFTKR